MIKKQEIKPNITPKSAAVCIAVIFLTVAIDFISKRIIMASMTIGQSIPLINGVFHFTYITNDGAAFGAFSDHRAVFMILSSVLLAVLSVMLIFWERSPIFYVGASMVIGGGIGNMIDRIAYGTVVDFLDFCAVPSVWKWIFNFADSFVCIGAGFLILYYIRFEMKNYRVQKAAEEEKALEEVRTEKALENIAESTGGLNNEEYKESAEAKENEGSTDTETDNAENGSPDN